MVSLRSIISPIDEIDLKSLGGLKSAIYGLKNETIIYVLNVTVKAYGLPKLCVLENCEDHLTIVYDHPHLIDMSGTAKITYNPKNNRVTLADVLNPSE